MEVGLLTSVSAIALVGYVGAVWYHGHLVDLAKQLPKDWQYLEWVAAVGILYLLARESYLHGPVAGLVGVAMFGFLLTRTVSVKKAGNDMMAGNLFKALSDLATKS
jgi:uncharacterized membrane protein YoaK (UPF0700 family)